eukprot:Gb_16569 [translate_table: standard]
MRHDRESRSFVNYTSPYLVVADVNYDFEVRKSRDGSKTINLSKRVSIILREDGLWLDGTLLALEVEFLGWYLLKLRNLSLLKLLVSAVHIGHLRRCKDMSDILVEQHNMDFGQHYLEELLVVEHNHVAWMNHFVTRLHKEVLMSVEKEFVDLLDEEGKWFVYFLVKGFGEEWIVEFLVKRFGQIIEGFIVIKGVPAKGELNRGVVSRFINIGWTHRISLLERGIPL